MEVCRKCGAPLRDSDKFCSQCGKRVRRGSSLYEIQKKRREEKVVNFRTKPEGDNGYRDHFAENENRKKAYGMTVVFLVLMGVCVLLLAAFLISPGHNLFSWFSADGEIRIIDSNEGSAAGTGPDAAASDAAAAADDGGNLTKAEGTADSSAEKAPDSTADKAADPAGADGVADKAADPAGADGAADKAADPAAADGKADSLADSAQAADGKTKAAAETGAETETEAVTEKESEKPGPSAAERIDPERLQHELDYGSTASQAEIYVYDLKNDTVQTLGDCSQPMYASALITVPILYTAASLVDSGELSMDTPVIYVSSIGGRGEYTMEQRDGLEFPLSFFLQTMTSYSDNNCINTLIDYLSLDKINSVCREAGFDSVNMERKLVNSNPEGKDNYISARDVSMMVKDLYSGRFGCIDAAWMDEYFRIDPGDSLPTLFGLASSLSDARILNQNGHGDTRYNETALISCGDAQYLLTVMLYGDAGFSYNPAVTNIAEYVNTQMTS